MVKCNRTFISIIVFSVLLTAQSLYAADEIKIKGVPLIKSISEPSQKLGSVEFRRPEQ